MKSIKMTIKSTVFNCESKTTYWSRLEIETIYLALHDFRLLFCLCISLAFHLCLHLFANTCISFFPFCQYFLTFSMGTNNMADGVPTYFMLIYPQTKHVLVVNDHERRKCQSSAMLVGNIETFFPDDISGGSDKGVSKGSAERG